MTRYDPPRMRAALALSALGILAGCREHYLGSYEAPDGGDTVGPGDATGGAGSGSAGGGGTGAGTGGASTAGAGGGAGRESDAASDAEGADSSVPPDADALADVAPDRATADSSACNGAVLPAPVARYTFDDCDDARGSLRDSSSFMADANRVGAVRCAGGHDGVGVYFNGDDATGNGYLTVPGPAVPSFSTGLTVSLWLSIWENRYANIIGRWFGDDSFLLLTDGSDVVFTVARPDGEGGVGIDYHVNASIVLYRWVHVVAVFNGQLITLYVDGRFAQAALVDPAGPLQPTSRPLQMGGLDAVGSYFKGMMDEVRLYDVALDPSQVRALDCGL